MTAMTIDEKTGGLSRLRKRPPAMLTICCPLNRNHGKLPSW